MAVSVRALRSPSPNERAFNGGVPWPAKGCIAAYAAGQAAHLLRRLPVCLAYSMPPHAESSGPVGCRRVTITAGPDAAA